MYLSHSDKKLIAGVIGLVATFGTIGGLCLAEELVHQADVSSTLSEETGFDVVDVQEVEFVKIDENYTAIIKCLHKETKEEIVVEYQLTSTDFIVMNQEGIDPWKYFSMHIIPCQDPSFVGTESEYTQYIEQSKTKFDS